MECAPAKPRPHLVGRGQTGERRSPDWHTLWPMRQLALTAERWTGQTKDEGINATVQLWNSHHWTQRCYCLVSHLNRKVSYRAAVTFCWVCVCVCVCVCACVTYLWSVGAKESWRWVCVSHLYQSGSMEDQQLARATQGLETNKIIP